MVTFSFIKPPARGSLRRRRMADALRRLTAALCVGLAVLFGLEAVLAVVETEPMVVAARSIRRGDIILAADVQLADMPVSAAGPSWTGNIEDVVGSANRYRSSRPHFHAYGQRCARSTDRHYGD